jgi:microcystin-dependent protein
MATPFLAQITIFASNFAPKNWAFCNGQILPIAQNQALFSLLGTTYGGNGQTTFALPNLQGRVPIHVGQGPGLSSYVLGQTGGAETHTLTVNEMPAHTHPVQVGATAAAGNAQSPINNILATDGAGGTAGYSTAAAGGNLGGVSAGNTGGSQPMSLLQPYLAINYIIALFGIFPSRN